MYGVSDLHLLRLLLLPATVALHLPLVRVPSPRPRFLHALHCTAVRRHLLLLGLVLPERVASAVRDVVPVRQPARAHVPRVRPLLRLAAAPRCPLRL